MFQGKELERLRLHKEQLMSHCDVTRRQFIEDWNRLKSSELWLGEMTGVARRHPWWIVSLAVLAGTAAVKTVQHGGIVANKVGRLGKFVSVALGVWKMFQRRQT